MASQQELTLPSHQYSLSLIAHKVHDSVVDQRAEDGYINATAMCKAAGKKISHYFENSGYKDFIAELESDAGIPASELVQVIKGGDPLLQGTWVHPQVAVHLAQWLSPKFAVQVSKWVYEWMSGTKRTPAKLPYHLRRHMLNLGKVPSTHFSILQEMTNTLIAPLEVRGYSLPESMMPDISQGRMFCKFLRGELGIDTKTLPTYKHEFENRPPVEANLYPIEYLAAFRTYINDKWMPERSAAYFKERDPTALPALDQLLMIGHRPEVRKLN